MAHRGRLNVLVNILGRENPRELLTSSQGNKKIDLSSGATQAIHQRLLIHGDEPSGFGEMHLALAFQTPLTWRSYLGSGRLGARPSDRRKGLFRVIRFCRSTFMVDAAFEGRAVVIGTFQMSQTRALQGLADHPHHRNNKPVGFTTSRQDGRSLQQTVLDVAKMISGAIFL